MAGYEVSGKKSSLSPPYSTKAVPICFWFERSTVFFAAVLAWAKTGKRMAARIAMMAMTTTAIIMMFCDGHDDVTMAFRAGEAGGYHRVGSRSLISVYCVLLIHRLLLAYRKCNQIQTSSS